MATQGGSWDTPSGSLGTDLISLKLVTAGRRYVQENSEEQWWVEGQFLISMKL
jgi:hypothetical protein